ncbi:MAG TPA: ABC transporter permease [Blastocatellia bacterium]|nr:ABC transporter permease [Blastocatellia bacterium]
MGKLLQDIRYGWRMLIRHRAVTAIAVVTLALGIGANTAIFSVVNAVLLRPLSYREPERLVSFRSNQSVLDVADVKAWSQSFTEIGGNTQQPLDYTGSGEPLQWTAGLVTGGFFRTLGAPPLLGRVITEEDDRRGGPFVVVLGYALWQRQFGGDPGVVGRNITLSGNSYNVVGVMPADFKAPRGETEAWAPVQVVSPLAAAYRGVHFLQAYARLKPGVTIAQAQSEMGAIDKRMAEAFPAENKRRQTALIPLHDRVVGEVKPALLVLFGAVGLVLLIACVNFANLLLARGAARGHELVVRVSLGASRSRLTRQLLTESVLMATLGGAAGVALAIWGVDLLVALKPANLPRLETISVDARALLFTLAVSVLTGLVFGLAPAWQAARVNVSDALKEGGRGEAGVAKPRLRSALVVVEMALALALLAGAGLLVKSFWQLRNVQPGFDLDNALTMRIELPEARYREIPAQTQYRRTLLDEVNSLPGARAALVSELPMSGDWLTHDFLVEGQQLSAGEEPDVQTRSVEGDYFHVMRIPLLSGRDFTPQDNENAPLVGIINQSLARRFFKEENPLGKRVRWARDDQINWITIIGVAGDVKHFGLDEPEEPALYTPYPQSLRAWKRWMNLVVRSEGDPAAIAQAVKSRVWRVDGQIPVTRARTMIEVLGASVEARRFNMLLFGVFAAVAMLLAAVGIYGVMSYAVTQRTREIGVRIALGARPRDVIGMVVGRGMLLTSIGVAAGLGLSLALTRLMSGMLFGVGARDPLTFTSVSSLLVGVALLACYIPARRATKVDPMIALRRQ